MSRRLLSAAVVLGAIAVADPAGAHVGMAAADTAPVLAVFGPETLAADAPASPGPWLLVAGAAVALGLTLRSRRALTCAMLLLLVLGAFETGLHSTHHLARGDGAKCAVSALSSHTGGVTVNTVAVERPSETITFGTAADPIAVVLSRSLPPDVGRAPPAA
jgi:hypothetical protein